ncbi:glycosyltransferase [Modestobacter roseus]|uniref:Glycosyltransferase involved in cell wall biosynthesis n=1 Tax=Modestobacter roseus TaxID=1181884 RepID=A0A562IKZ6_9ACTN|nr:glycosyltransferase [Modestobacter roseus]MQA32809.1 glycosyltransferase [Modestobacter roseus]TWH71542.1 glycosyltransferase involved in cell wall biosynthesis [Modestobacter roseus]
MTGHPSTDLRPLTVLQSFPEPRPTTNPYVVMLRSALDDLPGVEVLTFSWRRALTARYDVVHAHWPEILVDGRDPGRRFVRQALFVLLLLRLRVTRTPLVRTVHNLELPQGLSRRQSVLLRWAQRRTTLRIRINETTALDDGTPVATVVHGHYRDWYAEHPRREVQPGRLAFVGQVRRYKGVDRLVEAFRSVEDATLRLRIAGRPTSGELADELRAGAAADPRISLSLDFLPDAELVAEISAAELVVLPYREMHNSGGALAALSLGRPVLVPDNLVNRRLAEEVGAEWVLTFDGPLTGQALAAAVSRLRAMPPAGRPDLSRREWDDAGRAHVAAYRQAIGVLRG